jgi:sec-independent protein translocase protein TatA
MPFHWFYIVGLLLIVLIIFGPGRLPELGGAVGKAMREFRKATSELTNEVTQTVQAPAPPSPAPPAQPAESAPVKGPESASSSNS